jgi:hypothetical protein
MRRAGNGRIKVKVYGSAHHGWESIAGVSGGGRWCAGNDGSGVSQRLVSSLGALLQA